MSEKRKIGEILRGAGVIDEFQLRSALGEQQRWGSRLGVTLIKLGFIGENELIRALARQLDIPIATLDGKRIEPEVLGLIPRDLADKLMCLPLFLKQEAAGVNTLFVAMDDPCDDGVLDELRERTGMDVRPVLMAPSELCEGIDRFYPLPGKGGMAPQTEPTAPKPVAHEAAAPEAAAREAAAPATAAQAGTSTQRAPVMTENPMLRALAELLIEKGFVDPNELEERMQVLQLREKDSGAA
jgi:type IV pilus assembly protein PilB